MGYVGNDPKIVLREIIHRSVMGKSKLWPINPKFPAEGTLERRFNGGLGDKQILLWAIDESAQRGLPIPEWAAKALNDFLYRAAEGEFRSWDDVFGKIFAGKQQRRVQTLSRMLDVYYRVCELSAQGHAIDNALFERVGEELKLPARGKTTIQDLYLQVKAELEPQ